MRKFYNCGVISWILVLMMLSLSLPAHAASKIEATWVEVIKRNQAYVRKTPDDLDARFKLAVAYANLGHLDKTIKELDVLKNIESGQKATRIIQTYEDIYIQYPENLQVMNYLAFAYYANDQFDDSEVMFRQIVQADPEHLWAHNYYALVQGNQGKYDEAIATLDQASKIEENKYTHFILSLVYYKKGNVFKSLYHLGKSGDVGVKLLN